MRVITRKRLIDFSVRYPQSKEPLSVWYAIASKTDYRSFAELRKTFPSADLVGSLTVFNIGSNKYRLITAIHYNTKMIFIRYILTHEEYDKGKWID